VVLAGSKIDSSKFYYCEKSEDLYSCYVIFWVLAVSRQKLNPNVNNGLDTGQNKAVNIGGQILTSVNIMG
jgi:hypothetical protein